MVEEPAARPLTGIPNGPDSPVALIVPPPLATNDAPVPTTIAAEVLVLDVIALKVDGPAGPCGPVAPAAPAAPVAPCGPVAPAGPCGPVAPAAPVGPAAPVAPVAPICASTSQNAGLISGS